MTIPDYDRLLPDECATDSIRELQLRLRDANAKLTLAKKVNDEAQEQVTHWRERFEGVRPRLAELEHKANEWQAHAKHALELVDATRWEEMRQLLGEWEKFGRQFADGPVDLSPLCNLIGRTVGLLDATAC
jgi:chromosome segregation ATPase